MASVYAIEKSNDARNCALRHLPRARRRSMRTLHHRRDKTPCGHCGRHAASLPMASAACTGDMFMNNRTSINATLQQPPISSTCSSYRELASSGRRSVISDLGKIPGTIALPACRSCRRMAAPVGHTRSMAAARELKLPATAPESVIERR